MAQLDARLTGDQEVAGSTPAEFGNILSWRLIMKYFLRSFFPVFQLPARPARISHKIRQGRKVLKDVRPPDVCSG